MSRDECPRVERPLPLLRESLLAQEVASFAHSWSPCMHVLRASASTGDADWSPALVPSGTLVWRCCRSNSDLAECVAEFPPLLAFLRTSINSPPMGGTAQPCVYRARCRRLLSQSCSVTRSQVATRGALVTRFPPASSPFRVSSSS